MRTILLLFFAVAVGTSSLHAQVHYVDAAASGANTGQSWQDAFTDLQTALTQVTSGQVWVAAGTYYPAAAGDQSTSFVLQNGLELYGGFGGFETQLQQRDIAAYPTILSGDIDQNDTYGSGQEWWRYGWNGNAGNSEHIVRAENVDASAILDGFTLFAGQGYHSGVLEYGGGGMWIENASPTVRQCIFQYCALGPGSSVYILHGSPLFEDCQIRDAYTFMWDASGVFINGSSDPVFRRCLFRNHYTVTDGNQMGSGVNIEFAAGASFYDCDFEICQIGNYFAMGDSSGSYGGAIGNMGDRLYVENCRFVDNFSDMGSGIMTYGSATILNSLFARNLAEPYSVNSWLEYGDRGAGIAIMGSDPVTVANCTFVDNECRKGAGIYCGGINPVVIRNTILYNNISTPKFGEPPIFPLDAQVEGNFDLQFSCVEGLMQKEDGEDPPEADNFPGCFDQAPQWLDLPGGDYRLQAHSPCINSGSDADLPPQILVDLDGNPRRIGPVDLGGYEFAGTPEPSLVVSALVTELNGWLTTWNALPQEWVHFAYSFNGLGTGPAVPALGGLHLGILDPVTLLASIQADANGRAHFPFQVPISAPLVDIFFQTAMARGVGGVDSVLTLPVQQHIYLKP